MRPLLGRSSQAERHKIADVCWEIEGVYCMQFFISEYEVGDIEKVFYYP